MSPLDLLTVLREAYSRHRYHMLRASLAHYLINNNNNEVLNNHQVSNNVDTNYEVEVKIIEDNSTLNSAYTGTSNTKLFAASSSQNCHDITATILESCSLFIFRSNTASNTTSNTTSDTMPELHDLIGVEDIMTRVNHLLYMQDLVQSYADERVKRYLSALDFPLTSGALKMQS